MGERGGQRPQSPSRRRERRSGAARSGNASSDAKTESQSVDGRRSGLRFPARDRLAHVAGASAARSAARSDALRGGGGAVRLLLRLRAGEGRTGAAGFEESASRDHRPAEAEDRRRHHRLGGRAPRAGGRGAERHERPAVQILQRPAGGRLRVFPFGADHVPGAAGGGHQPAKPQAAQLQQARDHADLHGGGAGGRGDRDGPAAGRRAPAHRARGARQPGPGAYRARNFTSSAFRNIPSRRRSGRDL